MKLTQIEQWLFERASAMAAHDGAALGATHLHGAANQLYGELIAAKDRLIGIGAAAVTAAVAAAEADAPAIAEAALSAGESAAQSEPEGAAVDPAPETPVEPAPETPPAGEPEASA